jgi:lipopolysaccharide/colanic/teichoic acid biosynthesis glycosyltransferase
MARLLFSRTVALLGLIALAPLVALAAAGIALTSPGPILYRARRVGKDGEIFTMHKLRTMHHETGPSGSAITGANDPRVFRLGSFLRRWKIDELPQLYDVLRGKMSIVGPRPEDPGIVEEHYTPQQWETLRVPPGLASPGSLFNYTHGDGYLEGADPELSYIRDLLPIKLALETVYVRRASLIYDLRIVARTVWVFAGLLRGREQFPDPPEMSEAMRLVQESRREGSLPEPLGKA